MRIVLLVLLSAASGCAPTPSEPGDSAPGPPDALTTAQSAEAKFGQSDAKLVDSREALKDPKVVRVDPKIQASDPVTAATQGLHAMTGDILLLGLKQQIGIQRELNDGKHPSFDQLAESVRTANIRMVPLPPWQVIGYDETTGEVEVLEDKGEKIRLFQEQDIPIHAADRKYVDQVSD